MLDWIKEFFLAILTWIFDGWIMWAVMLGIILILLLMLFFAIRIRIHDNRRANRLRLIGYRGLHDPEPVPAPERPTETIRMVFVPDADPDHVTLADLNRGIDLSGVVSDVRVDTGEVHPPIEETDDDRTASNGPEHEGDPDWITPVRRSVGFPSEPGDAQSGREPGCDDLLRTDHGHVATNRPDKIGIREYRRVGYGPWTTYLAPGERDPYRQFE